MFGNDDHKNDNTTEEKPASDLADAVAALSNNPATPQDTFAAAPASDSPASEPATPDPTPASAPAETPSATPSPSDASAAYPTPKIDPVTTAATDAILTPPIDLPTPSIGGKDNNLLDIKQNALEQLRPLVDHLDSVPEEKFDALMMMIRASDDQGLIQPAYESAQKITDDKKRAEALLDVVNEINYLTNNNQ